MKDRKRAGRYASVGFFLFAACAATAGAWQHVQTMSDALTPTALLQETAADPNGETDHFTSRSGNDPAPGLTGKERELLGMARTKQEEAEAAGTRWVFPPAQAAKEWTPSELEANEAQMQSIRKQTEPIPLDARPGMTTDPEGDAR